MEQIFISYNNQDKELVDKFCAELHKLGISTWRYPQQQHDANWRRNIPSKIAETFATVVFWTPNSIESELVIEEADCAKGNNKLIQVLLGAVPPFGFKTTTAWDLSGTTFDDSAWHEFVSTVEGTIVKAGWRKPVSISPQGIDWVSWCAGNRRSELETLAEYVIERGLIFLYGPQQWSNIHLQALSLIAIENREVVHSEPRFHVLEMMLDYNENKKVGYNIQFVDQLSELNTLLAATAYAFANDIDFSSSSKLPSISKFTLSSPNEFVEAYFWSQLEIDGEVSIPARLETARECFKFFFEFLTNMLKSVPKTADQFVIVWPVKLIDDLLSRADGSVRRDGKDLLRKPLIFAAQLMEGVKRLAESSLQGRVGFIVETGRFPCADSPAYVAQRCVLVAPPLSREEIRQLLIDQFPKNADRLNVDAILAATGGIWHWLDPLFRSYKHILASPTDNVDGVMESLIAYLSGHLRDPEAAHGAPGARPPAQVLESLRPLIEQAGEMGRDMRALHSIYTRGVDRLSTVDRLLWNETYDPLVRGTLASLVTGNAGGVKPRSRFQVFSNFPRVSCAPMPDFVAALAYYASHNVVR